MQPLSHYQVLIKFDNEIQALVMLTQGIPPSNSIMLENNRHAAQNAIITLSDYHIKLTRSY
jgi:hypothetical protein